VAKVFPSAALARSLHGLLGTAGGGVPGWAWLALVLWAVLAPLLAVTTFRWE
jgi:hypothetical protein